jgi:hypothetical protein
MATPLLFARVVLAVIFSVAALAKLADGDGFRRTLRAFRVPRRFVRPLGILVPAAELAVAAGLVTTRLAWIAALAALALLLLFSATIGVGLGFDYWLECRCFGALGEARVGRRRLLRNSVLASLSAFVVASHWAQATSAPAWLGSQTDELIVGLAICLTLVTTSFLVRPRGGRPPAIGEPAPIPEFRTIHGDAIDVRAAGAGGTLLVFWDATCTACEQMRTHLSALGAERRPQISRLIVISSDTAQTIRAAGLASPVVKDEGHALARAFGVPGKPAAVLLDREGRIASDVILGTASIVAAFRDREGFQNAGSVSTARR